MKKYVYYLATMLFASCAKNSENYMSQSKEMTVSFVSCKESKGSLELTSVVSNQSRSPVKAASLEGQQISVMHGGLYYRNLNGEWELISRPSGGYRAPLKVYKPNYKRSVVFITNTGESGLRAGDYRYDIFNLGSMYFRIDTPKPRLP